MAPFAPFLSDTIYQSLRGLSNSDLPSSVHLCLYPESNNNRIKPLLEQAVTRMQHIILLGRQKRNQEKVKTKYPVGKLTVVHRDPELLEEIAQSIAPSSQLPIRPFFRWPGTQLIWAFDA